MLRLDCLFWVVKETRSGICSKQFKTERGLSLFFVIGDMNDKKIKFVLQISVENNDYNKSLTLIIAVTCFTFSILNTHIDIQFNKH